MGLRKKVSEQTVPKIYDFGTRGQAAQMSEEQRNEISWMARRLYELGVLEMAPSTKPPGFYVNWTTVTGIIALCVFIGGIFAFAWNVAYEQGKLEAERQILMQRLTNAEDELRRTKELKLVEAGQSAGHIKEKK